MTCDIIQLVRGQILLAAEEVVQIHLQPTIDLDELQLVLSARNLDAGFLHFVSPRILVPCRTHLILISRQLEKFLDAIVFLCSLEHKIVVKPKYIVSNYDVGVLSLDQFLPRQQDLALCRIMLQNTSLYRGGFIQCDTVIHVRVGISVIHKCRANKGHLVSLQLWEVGI